MGRNIKSLIITGGLCVASVATFTGCAKGDRSSGQYIDDRMTAHRVKSELKGNPIYKFEDVAVNAYRGVVQLNGWVTKPEQKQIAERIARNTQGVVDVVNNLSFKPQFQLVPGGQAAGGTSSGTTQTQGGQTSQDYQRQQQEQRTQDRIDRQQNTTTNTNTTPNQP
jgi:hyperosmotically inducible protein